MTDVLTTKKPKKQKAAYPFPVELIDQLLAQVENKDAESIQWYRQHRDPVGPSQSLHSWHALSCDTGAGTARFASMIGLPAGTRAWLAAGVTDMRSGFNGWLQRWRRH
jgi:hypothetical protein